MNLKRYFPPLCISSALLFGCSSISLTANPQSNLNKSPYQASGVVNGSLSDKAFSYEIQKYKTLEAGDGTDVIEIDGRPMKLKKNQAAVELKSEERLLKILKKLDAKVIEQETYPVNFKVTGDKRDPKNPPIQTYDIKRRPAYLLDVATSDSEDLSDLDMLAAKAGLHGHYKFHSQHTASLVKRILKLKSENRDDIVDASLNVVFEPAAATPEGGGASCPNTSQFWWAGSYSSYPFGANINSGSSKVTDFGNAAGVVVAVIDGGFQASIESTMPYSIVKGLEWHWNVVTDTADIQGATSRTGNAKWHGRKAASLIFAPEGDSSGTVGCANGAQPYLIHTDFDTWNNGQAIDSARDNGAKIINMSFYGFSPNWDYSKGAIDRAYAANIIMVACGGNDGNQITYPAAYNEVMGVGAHDQYGNKSVWGTQLSNTWNIDIWAPGTNITSASDGGIVPVGIDTNFGGTSAAAPIVSSILAVGYQRGKFSNLATAISRIQSQGNTYNCGRAIDGIWTVM